jgi:hypothetical protein
MAGHSASKDARKRAYVPAIHVLLAAQDNKDVDARHKAGPDGELQELVIPAERASRAEDARTYGGAPE